MSDGSPHDAMTAKVRGDTDIEALYMLFLGRVPESDAVRSENHGRPFLEIADAMIGSPEFREHVFERCLRDGSLPHDGLSPDRLRTVAVLAERAGLMASAPIDCGTPEMAGAAGVISFGWRSALYRVFASGPAGRLLERHHGAPAETFVSVLRPARPGLMLKIGTPGLTSPPEAIAVHDRLWIDGWALARANIASIEILAGSQRVAVTSCGLPSADLEGMFPDWPAAYRAGFAAMIPAGELPAEARIVRIVLHDQLGQTATAELFIERAEASCERAAPSEAEIEFYNRLLANCEWQPCFCIVMALTRGDQRAIDAARASLAALRDQPYPDWCLLAVADVSRDSLSDWLASGAETVTSLRARIVRAGLVPRNEPESDERSAERWRERLLDGFPELVDRVAVISATDAPPIAEIARRGARGRLPLVLPLDPGVRPSPHALYELAATSAIHPWAELISSDPADIAPGLFCATAALIDRAGVNLGSLRDLTHLLTHLRDVGRNRVSHVSIVLREYTVLPKPIASFSLSPFSRQSSSGNFAVAMDGYTVYPSPKAAASPNSPKDRLRTLLVSILSLGRPDNVMRLMASLPQWLSQFSADRDFRVVIVVRNNDPQISFNAVEATIDVQKENYPLLRFRLFSDGPNLGFGKGHNENYKVFPADYLLVLNDDMAFPDFNWLYTAIDLMEQDSNLALLGAESNPRSVSPFFVNGHFPHPGRVETIQYVEASVMLARGSVFEQIGMFNDQIEWAMCEDTDLSLRVQSLGHRIGWLPIPHEHWRSTSFNSLPREVKSSILEHNRATLISFWRQAIQSGMVGRYDVFDIWSDGLGDVFCVLPHLWKYLKTLTQQRLEATILNTSAPELVKLIAPEGVAIENFEDVSMLSLRYSESGFNNIRTIRGLNYSIPTHMQALLCGALSIPIILESEYQEFGRFLINQLKRRISIQQSMKDLCVVHLEITRKNFAGRGPKVDVCKTILNIISEYFKNIAIIGLEHQWPIADEWRQASKIVDYRGKLRLLETLSLVSGARFFVGVDSLPAHVAQACGVNSAILFGSVHPLVWVWDQKRVWPITASLPCIGCYQTHLEPGAPFCMRRDEACMSRLSEDIVRTQIDAAINGRAHDWGGLIWQFRGLQERFYRFLRYHPAPPERVFRPQVSSNEQISNLIFEITDKMADMLHNQYQTAAVKALRSRVADLERELNHLRMNR